MSRSVVPFRKKLVYTDRASNIGIVYVPHNWIGQKIIVLSPGVEISDLLKAKNKV